MRHYTITVRAHGVSRRVRKLLTAPSLSSKIPSLAGRDDIADYLLRRAGTGTPGIGGDGADGASTVGDGASTAAYESESEGSEAESDTNAVELPDDYGRGNKKGDRKAVRLVETGPRLEMRLIKVVEGLVGSKKGEGETVFHDIGECGECKRTRGARRAGAGASVSGSQDGLFFG